MLSNRVAIIAVVLASVVAAAGGGYIAGRQTPSAPADMVAATTPPPSEPAAPAAGPAPVQETEAIVGEPADAPAPAAEKPAANRAAANPPAPRRVRPAPARERAAAPAPEPAPAPVLERTWPSSASQPALPPAPEPAPAALPMADERAPELARVPEPPTPAFEELVVPADSVIGLQTETSLSSERARIEDRVEARVVRDVRVGGRVAIPAGSRALGSVTLVERGGRMRERARIGIRFHTLALADGTRLPITTETIYRYGEDRGNRSAAKIGGGAVAGAILGAILGGGKGAAVGATTGAAGGTAAVMSGDRSEATFAAGSEMTARILSPVNVTIER